MIFLIEKRGALIFLIVCFAVSTVQAEQIPEVTESLAKIGPVEVGKPAPWFAAQDARDIRKAINLTNLLKKPSTKKIVLVFFATWCKPCINGLRMLRSGKAKLDMAGVKVVLVDVQEEPKKVISFLDEMGLIDFKAAVDRFCTSARAYGLMIMKGGEEDIVLPKTFVIDRSGKLISIFGIEGRDYIERILKSK